MSEATKNNRIKRHKCLRKKIKGTSLRPRLLVRRSLKYLYAFIIDDEKKRILLSISTADKNLNLNLKSKNNIQAANLLGEALAKRAKEKNITNVIFDRAGLPYHGRIKALADSARKNGLQF